MKPWQECSERLIVTGELDPVYNVVAYARDHISKEWAEKFCMAHLMFYNVETSFMLAEVPTQNFWFRTLQIYHGAKRGQERRHYRGQNGLKSIDSMRNDPPGTVLRIGLDASLPSLKSLSNNIARAGIQGFGTYFLLKWADLLDVLYKANMDYSGLVHQPGHFLFEGAAKGLESIWPGRPHHESLMEIKDFISGRYEPFQGYRACGLSEAETIACAYRTYYVKTTYKFGWDINNLRSVFGKLADFGHKHAEVIYEGLPAQTKEWK